MQAMRSFDLRDDPAGVPLGQKDDKRRFEKTLFQYPKGAKVIYRRIAYDYSELRLFRGVIEKHEMHCGWPIDSRTYVIDAETGIKLIIPSETPAGEDE